MCRGNFNNFVEEILTTESQIKEIRAEKRGKERKKERKKKHGCNIYRKNTFYYIKNQINSRSLEHIMVQISIKQFLPFKSGNQEAKNQQIE